MTKWHMKPLKYFIFDRMYLFLFHLVLSDSPPIYVKVVCSFGGNLHRLDFVSFTLITHSLYEIDDK